MHVTYQGPFDAVEIDGLTAVTVKRGDTIEVDDAFGARLVEQRVWEAPSDEVLAWVGKDTERAAALLRAERDGAQRPEVLDVLGPIVDPPPDAPEPPASPAPKRKSTGGTSAKEGD